MENVLKPIKLCPIFPSYSPIFFGEVLKESGTSYERGYVCITAKYPRQTDVITMKIGEHEVCKSLAPLSVPDLTDITLTFRERCVAEARLINPILIENTDFFAIEGNPIMFMEYEGKDYKLRRTNVMEQVIDFYSKFLRQSIKALEKTDNRAARQAILEMSYELKQESEITRKIDLELKLQEAFTSLTRQIAGEVN